MFQRRAAYNINNGVLQFMLEQNIILQFNFNSMGVTNDDLGTCFSLTVVSCQLKEILHFFILG